MIEWEEETVTGMYMTAFNEINETFDVYAHIFDVYIHCFASQTATDTSVHEVNSSRQQ